MFRAAASAAGIAATLDVAHIDAAIAHNEKWLPWLTQEIDAASASGAAERRQFRRDPVSRRSPARTAADADRFLTARGLVLRAIGAYGMSEFLRLTVGVPEANEAVVAALAEFMENRKAAANG